MNRATHQNGFILMPVVIAIVLIATIAYMLNNQSSINVDQSAGMQQTEQAENIARAGIAHATWTAQYSGCAGDMTMSTVPFGAGSYTASIDAAATSTTSYSLNPDYDSYIRETNPDTNYGSESGIFLGPVRRGLLYFDLSAITAGSRVVTATLWLYFTTNDPADAINIHPVNTAWTEAGATWNNMATAYNSEVFGVIPPLPAPDAWVAINLTALAQSWVNDAAANYGLMLLAESLTIDPRLSSREYPTAALRPYLQITTADGAVSPLQISASGTLTGKPSPANDISRTLARINVPAYQPAGDSFLQLQPGSGKDAMLSSFYSSRNYGDYRIRVETTGSSERRNLLQFDLAGLPVGAKVIAAQLQLYHTITETPGTDAGVSVHRVSRYWVEGTSAGFGSADGATWDTWDGTNAWTTAGGDYDPVAVATSPITDTTGDWESWDLTTLVQGWLDGSFANNGLLLKGTGTVAVAFASKEDADPALHPKLTITYTCECGSPCLAPQGNGKVAMVVVDPTTLVPADAYKKALFESWGYTVSLISENTNAAGYMTAADSNDVFYISETVNSGQVGTRIKDVPIGVVSEDGDYNADLGFATGSAYTVGSALNVTDISHYITAIFPTGSLDIYAAGMEQLIVSGTEAAGLQTLADSGGAGSLVVLDQGATMAGGGTAPGPRVMLPLGRDAKFNWNYLNGNGRLLVQRALQWGTGNIGGAPAPQLLFVSGGNTVVAFPSGDQMVIPTAQEQLRIDLIESWGYTVNLIADDDSLVNFDTAVVANDVAYVPATIDAAVLGTKLTATTIGVVIEKWPNDFGIATDFATKSRDEIDIIDNTHYITSPYSTGLLTYLSSLQPVTKINSGLAPDLITLGTVFNTGGLWSDALAVINPGGSLAGGGTAAGRRVQLPWGDATFDVAALNADGLTIMQRAIEWAEGAVATPPAQSVLLVVVDPASLTAQEAVKKSLMESWGYTVNLIDESASQADFDAAAAIADVAYVAEDIATGQLDTKLREATIGVVIEEEKITDEFGICSGETTFTEASIEIIDNTHYITEPFSLGAVTFASSAQPVGGRAGTLAPGLVVLAQRPSSSTSMLDVIETGGALFDTGTAAGRRVTLPWGGNDFDINSLTVDGLNIMRRAIEWGAGAGAGAAASSCNADYIPDTKLSEFSTSAYSSNNIQALTYLPAQKVFNGVTAPSGGAWISVNYADGRIYMTDMSGAHLTDLAPPIGAPTGVAYVSSGTWADHLVVIAQTPAEVQYYDLTGTLVSSFSLTGLGSATATGVTFLDSTASGTYDGHLAISDSNADRVLLATQGGSLVSSFDTSSFSLRTNDLAHIPGSDKLLMIDRDAIVYVVDFAGTVLGQYDVSAFGVATPEAFAVNPETCDHVAGDDSPNLVVTLGQSGGGGEPPSLDGVVFETFTDAKLSSNGNSLSINKPVGTVAGDLLIAAIVTDGDNTSSLAPPAGWSLINVVDRAREVTFGVWWKLAGASESNSYTFTWSSSEEAYGWIMRFTGHDAASPIDANSNEIGFTATPSSPSVTTTVDNALILRLGGFDDDDITEGLPGLSGHTAINMDKSGTGNFSTSGGSGYTTQAVAGASGSANFTLTKTEGYVTVTIAIASAP